MSEYQPACRVQFLAVHRGGFSDLRAEGKCCLSFTLFSYLGVFHNFFSRKTNSTNIVKVFSFVLKSDIEVLSSQCT